MTAWSRRYRRRLGVEIVLAVVVAIVAFVVAALIGTAARSHVPAPVLGLVFVVGVLAVARLGGVIYAVPVGVVSLAAYDWYFLPPLRELSVATVIVLGVYITTSVIVAEIASRADRRAEASEEARGVLANEQAALRRVATLVARGGQPTEVFAAVAGEIARVLGVDATSIVRLDPDGMVTVVAGVGDRPDELAVGSRWKPEPPLAIAAVLGTGRPARCDDYNQASGVCVDPARRPGIHSGVATPIVVEGRLWGAIGVGGRRERFPADTEQRMAGFTELIGTAIANADSRAQLTASRARIVAAADHARSRIERDLHDGTQQRLVALSLELRLAQSTQPADLPELQTQIRRVADELDGAIDELREIARGIHPAILSDGGLGPALRTLARRAAIPVELDIRTETRPPDPIEVAAYYVVSEALTNTSKHARASYARVTVEQRGAVLHLSIRDDGIGGADPAAGGSGLIGLRDRVQALGGAIEVNSRPGTGTTIVVELPLQPG